MRERRMNLPNQWCKIKLHDPKLQIDIKIDHSFEPADHVPTTGTILQLPTLKFDPKKAEWETQCEIEIGDKVWINYHAVLMALGKSFDSGQENPNPLYDEEGVYIDYRDLYMSESKMLNGYVLIETMPKKLPPTTLEMPERLKHLKSAIIGKVLKTGSKNKRYNVPNFEDADVEVGDFIVFQPYANRKIEHEMYSKRDLRVVQRRFIEAIVDYEHVGVMV